MGRCFGPLLPHSFLNLVGPHVRIRFNVSCCELACSKFEETISQCWPCSFLLFLQLNGMSNLSGFIPSLGGRQCETSFVMMHSVSKFHKPAHSREWKERVESCSSLLTLVLCFSIFGSYCLGNLDWLNDVLLLFFYSPFRDMTSSWHLQ